MDKGIDGVTSPIITAKTSAIHNNGVVPALPKSNTFTLPQEMIFDLPRSSPQAKDFRPEEEFADTIIETSTHKGLHNTLEKLANGSLQKDIELVPSVKDFSNVPAKVGGNSTYQKMFGELYANAKQDGQEPDVANINKEALSEYYHTFAKQQIEKGIPDEVRKDPLYQRKVGEVVQEAQEKGEVLDKDKLSGEALARYLYEKDLQEEKGIIKDKVETEKRIQKLEEKVTNLTEEHQRLSKEVVQSKEEAEKTKEELHATQAQVQQIITSFEELSKTLQQLLTQTEIEEDPKKKETLLQLLIRLMTLFIQSLMGAEDEKNESKQTKR